VLFDLGALTQSSAIWGSTSRVADSNIAQAFQAKILLKF
jgi:hypothetical protein